MKKMNRLFGTLVAGATLFASGAVVADSGPNVLKGRASVYEHLDPGSLEEITPIEQLKGVGAGNVAPTEIWRRLEHGERVECLSCIPVVSKLLYDQNAKTREISAWWLRRRILGVFGPGQVYEQTLKTLADQAQPEHKRAYAAEALGEFLHQNGIAPVATALTQDPSPRVRKSAAYALWRLNSQGQNGELAAAVADSDEEVRLQALYTAVRVHVFTGVDAIVARIDDPSPKVRKRTAEVLGAMRAKDAVVGLIAMSSPANESDPEVRASAVYALGKIADPAAKDAVNAAMKDPYTFVRDAAKFASRRL